MSDLIDNIVSAYNHPRLVGKIVRGDLYFHVSATQDVAVAERNAMFEALEITGLRPSEDFNVVKLARGGNKVSLLSYPEFLEDPFPKLDTVSTVDLEAKSFRNRTYRESENPPILHKKELLLSLGHPSRQLFEELTQSLEATGIRPAKLALGFKKQWDEYLAAMKVVIKDHKLMGSN